MIPIYVAPPSLWPLVRFVLVVLGVAVFVLAVAL